MAEPTAPEVSSPATPEHTPYVPDEVKLPEFTFSAVLMGAVLGIVFGASSLYLVLKVGLTVSASIPVAVLSITLFRVFSRLPFIRRANILENNIVQTTGSAGESIAFGVGVTMPALMLLGFEMDIGRVMVVSVLGGLLGILMMIPLRRAFIVKQHGTLKYPEGTACADVLIVGEKGGSSAKTVFVGFGIAFFYQFLWQGLKLWKDTPNKILYWFKKATPAIEVNPALLGVGYIIGTRISCIMVAGGVLASFVLIPAIRQFGSDLIDPLYPATKTISAMGEEEIWKNYVLYIGAGAVAAGGIISLFQAFPLILSSIKAGLKDLGRARGTGEADGGKRTDRDLPIWIVGVGSVGLVLAIWATSPLHQLFDWVPQLHMNLLGAILIVLFGFLFVTVSSRLTGEIGSSSNPISGMTVATLLLTCLIFLAIGWTRPEDRLTALSVAAVVCVAASNGGTTSQDLKTGFLVGATPKWQQLAIVIGALSSALVIGVILIVLNQASTVYTTKNLPALKQPLDVSGLQQRESAPEDETDYPVWWAEEGNEQGAPPGKYLVSEDGKRIVYLVDPGINGTITRRDNGTEVQKFKAPKAQLMAKITDGIITRKLPWALILLGVFIAVVLELCSVPSLPFAVGVYLPLSASTPILAGGLARYVADRWGRRAGAPPVSETEAESSSGVLLSTGYIAGGAIAGVIIAFLSFSEDIPKSLSVWQYQVREVAEAQTLDALAKEEALRELGLEKGKVPESRKEELDSLIDEIADLNGEQVTQYFRVKKGTVLKLPHSQTITVGHDAYLKDVAKEELGGEEKAQRLFDLNLDHLVRVAKGTTLSLPDNEELTVAQATPLSEIALKTSRSLDRAKRLWVLNRERLIPVPKGTILQLPDNKTYEVRSDTTLGAVAQDALGNRDRALKLWKLNDNVLHLRAADDMSMAAAGKLSIPAGTVLKLPSKKTFTIKVDSTLAEAAQAALGSSEKAQQLWDLNKGALQPEVKLPEGAVLKMPQHEWPALLAFGFLVAFLAVVGLGWLFRAPPLTAPVTSGHLANNEDVP
jgi:putative OPT family oligopeptide transporter